MAALTKDRNAISLWKGRAVVLKVKTNVKIFKGSLVAVDATGFALPAADAAGQKVIGIAQAIADNTGGADGAIEVVAEKGVFLVVNNGVNPAVQASIGSAAHVQDDQTIRVAGSVNSIVAGVIDFIDATSLQVGIYIA
jgi:hypothetical protein